MGSGWKGQNPIRNSLAPQWAVERQRLENRVGSQWLENTILVRFAVLISLKEDNISFAYEKMKSSFHTSPSWSCASVILLFSNQETPGCSSITWSDDVNPDVNYD